MSPCPQFQFKMECPQNRELFAFVLGEVAEDRMRTVVEHCRFCPKCSTRLGTICELGVAKPHLMRLETLEGCLGDWDPPLASRGSKVNKMAGREDSSDPKAQKEMRVFFTFNLVVFGVFVLLSAFAYSTGNSSSEKPRWSALEQW